MSTLNATEIAHATAGHQPGAHVPLTDAARTALRGFWTTLPADVAGTLSGVVKGHLRATGGAWAPCKTALRVFWAAMDRDADLAARWDEFAAESHWARIA